MSAKVWYVEHPLSQYEEDVKALARKKGLKIVDARFKGHNRQVSKAPALTKKEK
jgi:hypothetical protein